MPSITGFLRQYLGKEEPKPPPPISTGTASALLVIYTFLYVAPFYLSRTTRPSRTLSRDAPSVIQARILSVSLTCTACSAITLLILTSSGVGATYGEGLHSMGWWPVGLPETARALLLTAALFSGPLYETLIVHEGWRDWVRLEPVYELFGEWTTWRNIVAGPFTEEVLFRSASVPLMLAAETSVTKTIFLSPVIFGLAHFHHFYEFRVTHPHVPVAHGLLRSLLQLGYTSLFGAYATFLLLRTGSLLAIIVVHAFCNCMGFPRFWGRVEPELETTRGDVPATMKKPSVLWTVVYYALLVVGAVSWWKLLGPLTESTNALVSIDM
ncbi:CAAX prenyl protease [Diatrype stigma]|uniref:intramembrane prenyl-peptidase Rce1 n=1 Tax=Diatrype stigma TaxID=117547 RepID=A0AAN9YIC7_9PEZI